MVDNVYIWQMCLQSSVDAVHDVFHSTCDRESLEKLNIHDYIS